MTEQHFTIILPYWQKNKSTKAKDRISTNEFYRIHRFVKSKVDRMFYDLVKVAVQTYKLKPVQTYPDI